MDASPDNKIFAVGGMTADRNAKTKLPWTNINSDAMRPAKSKEVEQDQSEPAACRRPVTPNSAIISAISSPALRIMPNSCCARRRDGVRAPVRRLCRTSGPQSHSPDPILLHAAPAPERSSRHGRRRDLVGASRFHRQAGRLGQGFRSALAVAAGRAGRAPRVECAAFRVAERRKRDRATRPASSSGRRRIPGLDRARARVESFDEDDIAWQIESSARTRVRCRDPSLPPARFAELNEPFAPGRIRRAGQGNFHRRSRPDRRRAVPASHSPRTRRRLDRPRLARRLRGLPTRLPRSGSLQRRFRHCAVSGRACGGDRRGPSASLRSPGSRICART